MPDLRHGSRLQVQRRGPVGLYQDMPHVHDDDGSALQAAFNQLAAGGRLAEIFAKGHLSWRPV